MDGPIAWRNPNRETSWRHISHSRVRLGSRCCALVPIWAPETCQMRRSFCGGAWHWDRERPSVIAHGQRELPMNDMLSPVLQPASRGPGDDNAAGSRYSPLVMACPRRRFGSGVLRRGPLLRFDHDTLATRMSTVLMTLSKGLKRCIPWPHTVVLWSSGTILILSKIVEIRGKRGLLAQ